MAERNTVSLTFAGDATQLDRALDQVGRGAKDMAQDVEDANEKARRFSRSAEDVGEGLGTAAGKFRATNDLVDGFATTVGLSLPPQAGMIMGFADMADGLGEALIPALAKARPVMMALNATMRANPFMTVVTVLAALTAAFVVAYKKSETFRNIVDGSLRAVKTAFKVVSEAIAAYVNIWLAPWRAAIEGIKWLWDQTIGRLEVPDWVGKVGGIAGKVAGKIPGFAGGGNHAGGWRVVGENGPELERTGPSMIVPNRALAGGSGQIEVTVRTEGLIDALRKEIRVRGGNVQAVLGA